MITSTIIIILCSLLILAYLFDLTSSKTNIPSVILLMFLGWIVKQFSLLFDIHIPDLSTILPVLGTVGLILIVLEGSLELNIQKNKAGLIFKSFMGSFLSITVMMIILALIFSFFGFNDYRTNIINIIPLCIISSAIAIPSVRNLVSGDKEFVVFESSFSDIIGVLVFNFFIMNTEYQMSSVSEFIFQLIVMIFISLIATVLLSFLLSKIEHHIKFVPIVLLLILIYSASKSFHLPALIFILLFGIVISNFDRFIHLKWIEKFNLHDLRKETIKFHEIIVEMTFLVRSLFFLLFGYLIETSEILDTETLFWSLGIILVIYLVRAAQLKMSNINFSPLLFVAPRGLITILLFLSIDTSLNMAIVNKSLITQIILLTSFIMMFGLMTVKKKQPVSEDELINSIPRN